MRLFLRLKGVISIACVLSVFHFFIVPASAENGEDIEARYYYVGTIGDDLAIQMELVVESDDITGLYFYEKDGTQLTLAGKVDYSDSTFTIAEQDENDEQTGTFKGKFRGGGGAFGKRVEGEWLKANGLTALPFKLTKVADFVSSTVRQGTVIDASFSIPFFLSSSRPYGDISAALEKEMASGQNKFLKEAREFFLTRMSAAGWQQSVSYTIEYYSDELVSLSGEVFSYTGGAHGNTYFVSSNYWIRDGKAVRLELSDLFLPTSGYIKRLSDYCLNDLRKKGAGWVVNGELKEFKEEDLGVFAVSPRGIMFAFAPYAVGSYAEGPYFVEIAYGELRGVLNPEGPLKKLVSGRSGAETN